MAAVHIIFGILLVVASLAIILVVLFTNTRNSGINSAIGGGSSDSFFGKNASNTREAKIQNLTAVMVGIFFVITIVSVILDKLVK